MSMTKGEFLELTLAEQGLELINRGKHLTQIKREGQLLNLYSLDDFFVEVFYSIYSDKIDKIEVVNDLSRIDDYIDNNQKEEKPHLN